MNLKYKVFEKKKKNRTQVQHWPKRLELFLFWPFKF